MSSTEWVWVSRDCSLIADSRKRENAKLWTKISEHDFHPLKPGHSSGGAVPKKRASKSLTPSKVEVSAFMDPLSLMAAQDEQNEGVLDLDEGQDSQPAIPQDQRGLSEAEELWNSLMADALVQGARFPRKIPVPEPFHHLLEMLEIQEDKSPLRARLELLEGRTTTYHPERDGLAHRDLVNFVDLLNNQLAKHWKDDKRLPVINLTLQISKMMGEPVAPWISYYPCLFFLLSDLVTYFGQLVYDRLVSKCPGLRVNFTPADVSPEAQEMARSWLLKIVGVKELLPRVYLEASFLKCYRFLNEPEQSYISILERITLSIKGIANPLVASYARAYLVRCAEQALCTLSPRMACRVSQQNYEAFLELYKNDYVWDRAQCQSGLSVVQYLDLYVPCLKWLLRGQQFNLNVEKKDLIMKKCFNEVDNASNPGMIYKLLLECSTPSLVEDQVSYLTHLVRKCASETEYPVYSLICAFGKSLLNCRTLTRPKKLSVLGAIWRVISDLKNLDQYLECAVIWTSFTTQHLTDKELNVIMGDIVSHTNDAFNFSVMTSNEERSKKILEIVNVVLDGKEGEHLMFTLTLGNFLSLFDLMDPGDQLALSKRILDQLLGDDDQLLRDLKDPLHIMALIRLCEVQANSINALSIQDERRDISNTICRIILAIDCGESETDLEASLKLFTECRGKFSELDLVQQLLVQRVILLAVKARKKLLSKDKILTQRGKGFLQTCMAYVYITIPSISDLFIQFRLNLQAAEIAFTCRCLGQGEANVKAAIQLIEKIGENSNDLQTRASTEARLYENLCSLLSLLLVVPDNPERGALHLFKQTIKSVDSKFPWGPDSDRKCLIYIQALRVLSVACWDTYPYHIDGLESNDVLYGSDPDFIRGANEIATKILSEILNSLEELGSVSKTKQALAALKLFEVVVKYGDLDGNPALASLARKLWKLSAGSDVAESKNWRENFLSNFIASDKCVNLNVLLTKLKE